MREVINQLINFKTRKYDKKLEELLIKEIDSQIEKNRKK